MDRTLYRRFCRLPESLGGVASASLVATCAFALALAHSAGAATTYNYSDHSGPNYDFTGLNETVQTADDEASPEFEAPTGVGDSLVFSPSSFLATSSNASGIDTTHSTFNATIRSTGAAFVDRITITEGGNIILSDTPPGSGTAATGAFATVTGTVTVLDATNALDIGTILTFGTGTSDFDTMFTPGPSMNSLYVGLQPSGTFPWTASVDIDIASLVTGVIEVELQFDNLIQANSEVDTSAQIQKLPGSGPVITVIPEPGTFALLAPGLIAIALRGRRRRT